MLTEQFRDRVLGCLLGLAVGDALGSQFEGRSATELQLALGNAPTRMEGNERARLVAGEWTDDTGQLTEVVDSVVTTRGFSPLDIVGSLIDWAHRRPKGLGPHSSEVFQVIARDPDRMETAGRDLWYRSSGVAAGNGAMARCVAAPMFFFNNLDRMVTSTIRLCQVTHYDPRCVDSCLVVNFLMLQCINHRYSSGLIEQAISFLETVRQLPSYKGLVYNFDSETLHEYSNFSPFEPWSTSTQQIVITALQNVPKMKITDLRTTGFAVHTMQLAVWMLLNSSSYAEAVHRAVRLGGDADTQGAITGALMGARLGLAQIPNYWLAPLKDRARITSKGELFMERAMEADEEDFRRGQRTPLKQPPRVIGDQK